MVTTFDDVVVKSRDYRGDMEETRTGCWGKSGLRDNGGDNGGDRWFGEVRVR